MPPQDHKRSAWRQRCAAGPGLAGRRPSTRMIGRSPEMPKRHSRRRSQTRRGRRRRRAVSRAPVRRGRVRLSTSAVVKRLDGCEVVGADAQRAQPDAGQRGRHQRGALHVAGLAVLVDHRMQRAAVVRGGGGEGQLRLRRAARCAARTASAHTGSRPVSSVGFRPSRRPRAAASNDASGWLGVAVAAEPALPVGLHAHADAPAGRSRPGSARRAGRARWAGAACARTPAPAARAAIRRARTGCRTPGALRRRAGRRA